MIKKTVRICLFVIALSLLLTSISLAAPLRNVPVKVTQPDGEVLNILASGDEYYNFLHDEKGYTIVKNSEGYYVYADKKKDRLFPSEIVVNRQSPAKAGIKPQLYDSFDVYKSKVKGKRAITKTRTSRVSTTGVLNNVVIFIRFSGESGFTRDLTYFNGVYNTNTGSMKNFYLEASYNTLTINSSFFPASANTVIVSYEDSHTRNYYRPYSATNTIGYPTPVDAQHMDNYYEYANREHTLLKNAVDAVRSSIPSSLDLDNDDDGIIDAISFVIKGDPEGWADLLWPHKWQMFTYTVSINNANMDAYSLLLENHGSAGVSSHEMFHALGAPDLYHYENQSSHPVGPWDLMEYGTDPPQHMGAYMKYKYGKWISNIPEITTSGNYTLNSLKSSTNNAYKIKSSQNAGEYFVLEYRQKSGTFEGNLPNSGIIITRINESLYPDGNANGPPDEVYAFRKDGGPSSEGDIYNAYLSSNSGRTSFNSTSNPYPFFSDGSDETTINISNIGSAGGESITFYVSVQQPEQCNSCTDSCGDGYACVSYINTDGAICMQQCAGGESCPSGSTCADTTSYGKVCLPNVTSVNCTNNDVYFIESCGVTVLYKECNDETELCNSETAKCDALYTEENCNDTLDDDSDGKTDCEDEDCKTLEICGWDGLQCSFCDPSDSSTCGEGFGCYHFTNEEEKPWCGKENCTTDDDCPEGGKCNTTYKVCVPYYVSTECQENNIYSTDSCGYQYLSLVCESNATCNAVDLTCDSNCTPDTCSTLNKSCGTWSDGCEGTLNCGTCTDYENSFCNASGQCDCESESCQNLSVECGNQDDNCGGTVNCGVCDSGYSCVSGQCELDVTDGDSDIIQEHCDISGYKIVQTDSDRSFTIPENTILEPGDFFVLGRNETKASFEEIWDVTLGDNVIYANGENQFPTMNGEETYSLLDKYDNLLDGPTIAMPEDVSIHRISTDSASSASSWSSLDFSAATPGETTLGSSDFGIIISEFSDNGEEYTAEFVELYCNLPREVDGDEDVTDGDEVVTDGDDPTDGDEVVTDGDDPTDGDEVVTDGDDPTDGDEVVTDGDDTTDGDEVVTDGDDTTDGDDVVTDGDDTTDGDEVVTDGDDPTDGDETVADGDGGSGGSSCNSTGDSPLALLVLFSLLLVARRKKLIL